MALLKRSVLQARLCHGIHIKMCQLLLYLCFLPLLFLFLLFLLPALCHMFFVSIVFFHTFYPNCSHFPSLCHFPDLILSIWFTSFLELFWSKEFLCIPVTFAKLPKSILFSTGDSFLPQTLSWVSAYSKPELCQLNVFIAFCDSVICQLGPIWLFRLYPVRDML